MRGRNERRRGAVYLGTCRQWISRDARCFRQGRGVSLPHGSRPCVLIGPEIGVWHTYLQFPEYLPWGPDGQCECCPAVIVGRINFHAEVK